MRGLFRLVLCLALLAVVPRPAATSYVFYYKQFGDWTILCWDGQGRSAKQCSFYAPPASLGYRKPPNIVQVDEYAPNTFQVVIVLRDQPMPGLPAFVRVDQRKIHEAKVEGSYARWTGAEADAILAEMRAGKHVTARVQTIPDGLPRDTRISLQGFDDALATYRKTLREQGVLKGS